MDKFRNITKFDFLNCSFNLLEFRFQHITDIKPFHFHSNMSYEIHIITGGSGTFVINEREYEAKYGSIFVTGPFVTHGQIPSSEGLNKYTIYMQIEKNSSGGLFEGTDYNEFVGANFEIMNLCKQIHDELIRRRANFELVVAELVKICILKINRMIHHEKSIPIDNQINQYAYEIERLFIEEIKTVTLKSMADSLFMSERQLQRYLQKIYNKNFLTLKNDFKMQYAKNKLVFSDASINDISADLGFSTREHFCYFFKQQTGMTPLQYRSKNKEHACDII